LHRQDLWFVDRAHALASANRSEAKRWAPGPEASVRRYSRAPLIEHEAREEGGIKKRQA